MIRSMLGWQPQLDDFFSRPVRLFAWSDDAVPIVSNIFTNWAGNAAVASKLANYQGIRGTFCVRIQHNGSPYRCGKRIWALDMQLAADPMQQTYTLVNQPFSGVPRSAFQLSTLPIKAYTTPWTSETIDMKMPFMYNAQYYSKGINGPVLCSQPLVATYNTDNSAITNHITYVIYGWMEDIQLTKPSRAQSNKENPYRKVSGLVGHASAVAKDFGMNTTPIDMAKKFGDRVATALGYSKPSLPPNDNVLFAYGMSPTSTFNSQVAEVVVADGWENEEPVDAASLGFGSDDDTSIDKLARIPGIVAIIPMNNPSADMCVWSDFVRPRGTITSGIRHYPPAAYIANAFNYWSGDVVYHFDIVANPYCKGLVRIEFDPGSMILPLVGTAYAPAINTVQSIIIDLNSETSATIRCGWNAPTNALQRSDASSNTVTDPLRQSNGTIAMYVSSPFMIANTTTPTLRVIIWQSIENLRVYEFDQRNINGYTNISNAVQGDSARGFGSEITSINQICRMNTFMLLRGTATGAAGNFYTTTITVPQYPPGVYNSANASRPPNANWTDMGSFQTALAYFAPMFLARRGGTRVKITLGDTSLFSTGNLTTVNRTIGPASPGCTTERSTTHVASTGFTGCVNFPYAQHRSCVVEARCNRRSPMLFCDARSSGGGASLGGNITPCITAVIRANTAAAIAGPSYVIIGYAGDDSFTLNQYWGTPMFTDLPFTSTLANQNQNDAPAAAHDAAAVLLSLAKPVRKRQPQDDPDEEGHIADIEDMYSGVHSQPQSDECLPFTVTFQGPRARFTTRKASDAEASSDSDDP